MPSIFLLFVFLFGATAAAFRSVGGGIYMKKRMLLRFSATKMSGEDLSEGTLPFADWLNEIFPLSKFPISKLYFESPEGIDAILNTKADTGCIINNPARTMSRSMIDFDVEEAVEDVLAVSRERPDERTKPVIATVRGMGGGKTRAMEEIRRFLLRDTERAVLPLAITFNKESMIFGDSWISEEKFRKGVNVKNLYALSISARMLFSALGVPYSRVDALVEKQLVRLDLPSQDPATMVVETVKFLVRRVNETRAALSLTPLDTFVLLVDESRKAEIALGGSDLGTFLRIALLDHDYEKLNVSLVISNLSFLAEFLKTESNRPVKLLQLPDRLTYEKVVRDWWLPNRWEILTREQVNVFELSAASLNNMPRALQFAAEYLQMQDDAALVALSKNGTLLPKLYAHVFEKTRTYIPSAPPLNFLLAAFFGEEIELNQDALYSFMSSVFTNSILKVGFERLIVPNVALPLLKVLALDSTCPIFHLIDECIQKVLDRMVLASSDPRDGDALEEAVLQALRIRLALADDEFECMTPARLCGLSQLFRIEKRLSAQKHQMANNINAATAEALFAPIATNVLMYIGHIDFLTKCSREKERKDSFLAELASLEVDTKFPVRIICSCKGEAWDICVKFFNEVTKRPFYIFFDCKSGAEFSDAQSNEYIAKIKANPEQYLHTKKVLDNEQGFLFVYLSTHKDIPGQVLVAKKGEEDLPSRCILLSRKQTLDFLGPFSEIYKVARASLSNSLGKKS